MSSHLISAWGKAVMCYMIHPHANTVLGHLAPLGQSWKYESTGELGLTGKHSQQSHERCGAATWAWVLDERSEASSSYLVFSGWGFLCYVLLSVLPVKRAVSIKLTSLYAMNHFHQCLQNISHRWVIKYLLLFYVCVTPADRVNRINMWDCHAQILREKSRLVGIQIKMFESPWINSIDD